MLYFNNILNLFNCKILLQETGLAMLFIKYVMLSSIFLIFWQEKNNWHKKTSFLIIWKIFVWKDRFRTGSALPWTKYRTTYDAQKESDTQFAIAILHSAFCSTFSEVRNSQRTLLAVLIWRYISLGKFFTSQLVFNSYIDVRHT